MPFFIECGNCVSWVGTFKGICSNKESPRHQEIVYAEESCDKFELKEEGY